MTTIPRTIFTRDPVFSELHSRLKKAHVVAEHTKKTLYENRHIKDFCEIAVHFQYLPGKNPIYLHYEVGSWWKEGAVAVVFNEIVIYDDFMEYEAARMRGLHSGRNADIPNIN